jgi:hypothetical protein
MIDKALLLIRNELDAYVRSRGESVNVVIDNVGLFETSNGASLNRAIIITLVNVEEESTLKNESPLRRPIGTMAVYQNPPVFLNLYVLFTCNFINEEEAGGNYELALRRLSFIIRFLQSKNSFSVSSSANGGDINLAEDGITDLKFTLELYTLTFEQINHLWGSLGGRQMPFAMYKLRLVAITDRNILREVPVIEEIGSNLGAITTN